MTNSTSQANSNAASLPVSSQTDQLVAQYLKRRGYRQAADQLLHPSTTQSTASSVNQSPYTASLDQFIFDSSCLDTGVDSLATASATSSLVNSGGTQAGLGSAQSANSGAQIMGNEMPQQVELSYQRLKQWIEDSLDLYKSELQTVLYPFFVHIYLDWISRGFQQEARRFLEQHQSEFMDQYPQDIQQCQAITEPHHVFENHLAKTFRENKYVIGMSRYAFELLVGYLQDGPYWTLLKMLNQYINVKVYSVKPVASSGQQRQAQIGITGQTSQQIRTVNQQPIYPGKPGPSQGYQDAVEKGLKLEQEKTDMDLSGPADLIKQEKYPEDAPPKDESIPLPPKINQDVMEEIAQIQTLRDRIQISNHHLPSILTYTLHNTFGICNQVRVNEEATRMVGAMADSTVRVWSLTDEPLRSLKAATEFSVDDFENVETMDVGREPKGDWCKKLIGHSGPVFSTSMSPDSKYIISGSEDGTARLWSMDTYTPLVSYRGHHYPIWDVDFAPTGVYFATASHDRTARLWSCEHIAPLRIFASHLSDVECVKFHPNANYVATGSADRTVRLWDVHRGRCVRVLTAGHPTTCSTIFSVAISPNGLMLASGADDGSIVVWDLGSGQPIHRFPGRASPASTATSNPLSGHKKDVSGHSSIVYSLNFSSDSRCLGSGAADGTVCVWDVHSVAGLLSSTGGAPEPDIMMSSGEAGMGRGGLLCGVSTKRTPVHCVQFTRTNILISSGPFIPY